MSTSFDQTLELSSAATTNVYVVNEGDFGGSAKTASAINFGEHGIVIAATDGDTYFVPYSNIAMITQAPV